MTCAMQLDVAVDVVGHADKPDIALACLLSLKRHGILVLDGSMDCPFPIPYGELGMFVVQALPNHYGVD